MFQIKENKKEIKNQNGIKIYINEDYYSDSFGSQWNKFSKTQIDNDQNSHSFERFFNETGLNKDDFTNKNILEVGSGAGRFTDIILKHTKANVYSIDSSNAVFANLNNNKEYIGGRLNLYKASVYDIPFEHNQFDIVICFGVIQHTPDIKKTIQCLCNQVKKNGLIVVDFYPYNGFWTLINAKYIIRPFTKRLSVDTLFNFYKSKISHLIDLYFFLKKFNLGILNRFIPIADISNTIPQNISRDLLEEMVLLDTIDMLSPKYDMPQKISKIKNLISKENFKINFAGKIYYNTFTSSVVRGQKN